MTEATPVGAKVVGRIAAREGVDPVDLDVRLYDVIDPDALAALTNRTTTLQPQVDLAVEFSYLGYTVTVDGSGQVSIKEQPAAGEQGEPASGQATDD